MSDGKPDMVALMEHLAKAIVEAPDEVDGRALRRERADGAGTDRGRRATWAA